MMISKHDAIHRLSTQGPFIDPWGREIPHAQLGFLLSGCRGWNELTCRLVKDLVALGWDKHIHQVKEKFGGLRFYIGYGSAAIFDRIDEAERESCRTCQDCGEPGVLRQGGWLATLCDAHAGGRGPASEEEEV